MYIVTLLTNLLQPSLNLVLVESLRNAWGGGAAIWLNPGVAAEFPIEAMPHDLWDVWQDLQAVGVDLLVQAAQGRKKRLLIADMDSTMIMQECIDELAEMAGGGAHVGAITAPALKGGNEVWGAFGERGALLEGLPEAIIAQVIRDRITPMPGGRTLVATMKASGAYTALVSGGFTAFTSAIAAKLGFDENRANRLGVSAGLLTGTVAAPILGREAKVQALVEIAARLKITPSQAMAVGDGANDLGMLGLAGAGVALHAKPSVAAQCDLRVNHGDLTALLYMQGFQKSEFVE